MRYYAIILLSIICLTNIDCNEVETETVKYIVSGTAADVNIEYSINGYTVTLDNVNLPWEFEFRLWSDNEDIYTISLGAEKISGDSSIVDMEILVNGISYNSLSFNGPYEKETIRALIRVLD